MYVITEDHYGDPAPRGFSVQAHGGPTELNLVLESLLLAAQGLTAAEAIVEEQRSTLGGLSVELFGSAAGLALHPRIPLLAAQLGISLAEASVGAWTMGETARAVRIAQERYRDTESLLMSSFGTVRHLAQFPQIYPHLVDPQGDKALADAWGRTALVSLGQGSQLLLSLLARKHPVLRATEDGAGLVTQSLLEKARRISRESTQTLAPQTHRLPATPVERLSEHLQAHSEVAELGDFSISSRPRPGERARHVIHIPGLELPEGLEELDLDGLAAGELDLSAGRGLNSLLDAGTNDSAHLQGVIDQALQDSGALPGDELVVTGYSLGGLHALNIAAGGTLASKYRISQVATVAAPGREGPAPRGVRTTSFQDANDPVPRLLGGPGELSAERVQVTYERQDPRARPGGVFGASHSLAHNIEAIRLLEAQAPEHLDQGQRAQLAELTESLRGDHETTVYSTDWDSAGVERLQQTIAELAGRLEDLPAVGGSGVERAQDEAVEQR
ncbi:hypothetical protein [Nesterenkonia sandarakina]|uniref:Lipase (Class 3) n=1 Tax=Nesterenkonia sandarakina TaxID=272918 RepID=A0A2T0YQ44_9MICC|nr:hypothetical protein [Nesterenkonia sandarakina]PRZ17536.1 hypothetical protein BCL67_10582 [Nesterenkonia sandarakina]